MRWIVFITVLATLAGCRAEQPEVELRGRTFSVEVADNDTTRSLGLMYRDHMPADHGMLFVFSREEPRSFWMKNTRIPLDILYFDRELRLVSWSADTPPCRTRQCPGYPSRLPAQYVLEINAGLAAELGVQRGDRLEVRHVPGVAVP